MHRKSIARAAVALATITLGTSVWAGGNAERGKEKATQICAACHGLDGISQNPIYPHIGGQYQDYLLHALEGYKAGTRQNAIMQGMVAALNEQDLKDVAAYYAAQPGALKDAPH